MKDLCLCHDIGRGLGQLCRGGDAFSYEFQTASDDVKKLNDALGNKKAGTRMHRL